MSTIERAVALLNLFSADHPEIGLSGLCRAAGRDKATVYRHLTALEAVGLVEQNPETRQYRIGPAVLRWAGLREKAVPRLASVQAALKTLAEATGEMAHASLMQAGRLRALSHFEPGRHSTRVVIDEAELPLNATASGLAVLAFGDPDLLTRMRPDFAAHTVHTPITREALGEAIRKARHTGFGVSDQGYEIGVCGIAVPVFAGSAHAVGAIASAAISQRMTPALAAITKRELITASRQVSRSWGGTIPEMLNRIWDAALAAPATTSTEEIT